MPRITKGMIEAAYRELEGINALARDPQAYQGSHATYLYHARSANNYLDVLKRANKPLPEFMLHNEAYFKACGWRVT